MYRRYENPMDLEKELSAWLEDHPRDEWDDLDFETYQSLKDRINFAWQDDEYDEFVDDLIV